ncbi:MAG: Na(+)-translocating NADH-quinone reductase subunit F [Flavobacteriaceae bacterium]|nr:Na(+)-translocating NADH-quinone reductase subunit F [Flavobacteriaceae bacterium]|tara:strand:- start:567 stop:1025 length:459 start_codon:yes stop_codon:yes gene_type:complete
MKFPKRLETALSKLYTAYNTHTLHPEDACRCAVGNLLGQRDFWKHLSDDHGSVKLNYVGKVHEMLGRRFEGYLPSELLQIEKAFLAGCGYELPFTQKSKKPKNPQDREVLFQGLCHAIEALCSLENIPNVMEITESFEKIKAPSKERAFAIQ